MLRKVSFNKWGSVGDYRYSSGYGLCSPTRYLEPEPCDIPLHTGSWYPYGYRNYKKFLELKIRDIGNLDEIDEKALELARREFGFQNPWIPYRSEESRWTGSNNGMSRGEELSLYVIHIAEGTGDD